ncbi:MAG: T9SS type A sorting domain-containing protein [Bacteroidia bacterium]|nr:T9SS type A sorting domain-containing protein [Bacteroidia bacterium]
MKKLLTLCILAVGFYSSHAQTNLIINGNLDSATVCPNSNSQINRCYNWTNPNNHYTQGLWGSPDYFNVCGSNGYAPPFCGWAEVSPQSGDGMICLATYNQNYSDFREYVSAKLLYPLVPDVTYTGSFWVTNGVNNICKYVTDGLGIAFTDSALTQVDYQLINANPQFEVTNQISDTSWVQYTFSFTPTEVLNYITIGNFRNDANTNRTIVNPEANPNNYAIYFIDNFELYVDCNGIGTNLIQPSSPNSVAERLLVVPNPSGNFISANFKGKKIETIQILDLNGKLIQEDSKAEDIYIGNLSKGMYIVKAINGNWQASTKFVKE